MRSLQLHVDRYHRCEEEFGTNGTAVDHKNSSSCILTCEKKKKKLDVVLRALFRLARRVGPAECMPQ